VCPCPLQFNNQKLDLAHYDSLLRSYQQESVRANASRASITQTQPHPSSIMELVSKDRARQALLAWPLALPPTCCLSPGACVAFQVKLEKVSVPWCLCGVPDEAGEGVCPLVPVWRSR